MDRASGYTGPTSGRITISGDGEVTREQFHDRPLSADELRGAAEFLAMSPNEQAREYRRLKWNEDVYRREAEAWKRTAREQDKKILQLRFRLAQYAPDGYTLPPAAADLVAHAKDHGWATRCLWSVPENEDDHRGVSVEVSVGTDTGWLFKINWGCETNGTGCRTRAGLARAPRRDWYDAPSLKKIKETITANPVE